MSPTDAQFPLLPPPDEAARLRDHIIAVIRDLLDSAPRQPGPSELLDKIQAQLGWPARHEFLASVRSMREDHALQSYQRDYLKTVLSDDAINDALRGQARWTHEDHATLDDLFRRSKAHRDSNAFRDMLNFTARFRDYAPFNNLLVRLQYPSCSYFATARDWKDRFNRAIKEDARPLLILAPMHPVMCVYDLDSTEGPPLPDDLRNLAAAKGDWNPENLDLLLENARRDAIKVAPKPLSSTNVGFATTRVDTGPWKMRVVIHDQLEERASFAVLCHELAHIYLGHLGGDKKGRWPSRLNLTHAAVELEAESAAYITCTRLGITPSSERYLSGYLKNDKVISLVSIEMIVKVAGKLEGMARHLQPDRQAKQAPPERR